VSAFRLGDQVVDGGVGEGDAVVVPAVPKAYGPGLPVLERRHAVEQIEDLFDHLDGAGRVGSGRLCLLLQ